jgi:hypothetical protein
MIEHWKSAEICPAARKTPLDPVDRKKLESSPPFALRYRQLKSF